MTQNNDRNMICTLQNIIFVKSNVTANVTDHNLHYSTKPYYLNMILQKLMSLTPIKLYDN